MIKHRLCRRGKCRKNHKRNNTDKGVALSMDDVKRHVSAGQGVLLGGTVTVWGRSGSRHWCCGEAGLGSG